MAYALRHMRCGICAVAYTVHYMPLHYAHCVDSYTGLHAIFLPISRWKHILYDIPDGLLVHGNLMC